MPILMCMLVRDLIRFRKLDEFREIDLVLIIVKLGIRLRDGYNNSLIIYRKR